MWGGARTQGRTKITKSWQHSTKIENYNLQVTVLPWVCHTPAMIRNVISPQTNKLSGLQQLIIPSVWCPELGAPMSPHYLVVIYDDKVFVEWKIYSWPWVCKLVTGNPITKVPPLSSPDISVFLCFCLTCSRPHRHPQHSSSPHTTLHTPYLEKTTQNLQQLLA